MTLEVTYAHDRSSREPRPMKAQQIWSVADQVRRQLVPSRPVACLDLERLIRAAGRMMVNGIAIAAHWDFERSVHDGRGREALGVTEADPALPGIVLISLNAKLIAERDYLKRSTLAHEFGHALFDGPSMLRQAGQPAFAMVTPDEGHLAAASRGRGGMDWREFRANEFMGALLAPRALLHRELVRRAIALRLRTVSLRYPRHHIPRMSTAPSGGTCFEGGAVAVACTVAIIILSHGNSTLPAAAESPYRFLNRMEHMALSERFQ